MRQEELITQLKERDINEEVSFSKGGKYFKSARKFYKGLQDGKASEINFFENTIVLFDECERPDREPDFGSPSGSCYWYSEEGVIRGSDHWGCGVGNCDWALKTRKGETVYGHYWKYTRNFARPRFGFAKWEDFLFKARLIEIGGKEVVTTFNNTVGRDLIGVEGKTYLRKVIEVFEEVENV
ncbi:MAG: hypothetical protein K5908_01640 [Erysipelotrichaceae bacterium]|nr:hypothetical protein [Erysipelotrichaceae bacterium]